VIEYATTLVPQVQAVLGDHTGEVYPETDVLPALQNAYRHLLLLGFVGEFTTDDTGVTPDLTEREQGLFAVAAACILLGGRLADPSVSMSVKAEQTAFDGRGGASALSKRLSELESLLRKAILDGSPAVHGHEETIGLAVEDDSPIKGMW
jgi:hypothetical protein